LYRKVTTANQPINKNILNTLKAKEFEEWDFDLKLFDWLNAEGKKIQQF